METSLAILATNLFGATPALAVRSVSARIAAFTCRAISGAGPNSATLAVTSRKASSSESGSTSGVKRWKIARRSRATATYRSIRPRTTTACGQRASASAIGIAERTPKGRAS